MAAVSATENITTVIKERGSAPLCQVTANK